MWSALGLPVFFRRPEPWELPDRRTFPWWLGVWLPVMVAVAVIAMESTSTFSATNTSGWLRPFAEGIFGSISNDMWFETHHLLRKTGHFAGYSLVCLAFLRSWLITLGLSQSMSIRRWRTVSSLLAIGCTAVVASCDEFHQSLLPDRTGKFSDVVLDSTGAVVLCAMFWVVWRRGRLS